MYLVQLFVVVSSQHILVKYFLTLHEPFKLLQLLMNSLIKKLVAGKGTTFPPLVLFDDSAPQSLNFWVDFPQNIISEVFTVYFEEFANLWGYFLQLSRFLYFAIPNCRFVVSGVLGNVDDLAELTILIDLGGSFLPHQSVDLVLHIVNILVYLSHFFNKIIVLPVQPFE